MNSDHWLRIVRFIVSGGSATAVNFGTLYILTEYFHVWYIASSIVGVTLGFFVSFILQKFWTFKSMRMDIVHVQFVLYGVLFLFNLALNAVLLFILVEYAHVWYILSQFLISAALAVMNYFLYRRFVFMHAD